MWTMDKTIKLAMQMPLGEETEPGGEEKHRKTHGYDHMNDPLLKDISRATCMARNTHTPNIHVMWKIMVFAHQDAECRYKY